MEVIVKEKLEIEEEDYLFHWGEQVFPVEGRSFTWVKPEQHIVVYENQHPIAHLGFGTYELEVNGKRYNTIGVGGVVVRPEFQKQNIPKILFGTLHAKDLGLKPSSCYSLFCPERLTTYYSKHGYRLIGEPVEFLQHGNYVDSGTAKFMVKGQLLSGSVRILGEPW